jgi:hypothetical protein
LSTKEGISFLSCINCITFVLGQGSVADPGRLSWISDPDCYRSRIPVPRSKNRIKRWVEKNFYHNFFVVTNLTKLNSILFLKCCRK